jgi:hypothetical protein
VSAGRFRPAATWTDDRGEYRVFGLPPGEYLITAVEDVEQGKWFDPAFLQAIAPGAARLGVNEGGARRRTSS